MSMSAFEANRTAPRRPKPPTPPRRVIVDGKAMMPAEARELRRRERFDAENAFLDATRLKCPYAVHDLLIAFLTTEQIRQATEQAKRLTADGEIPPWLLPDLVYSVPRGVSETTLSAKFIGVKMFPGFQAGSEPRAMLEFEETAFHHPDLDDEPRHMRFFVTPDWLPQIRVLNPNGGREPLPEEITPLPGLEDA